MVVTAANPTQIALFGTNLKKIESKFISTVPSVSPLSHAGTCRPNNHAGFYIKHIPAIPSVSPSESALMDRRGLKHVTCLAERFVRLDSISL